MKSFVNSIMGYFSVPDYVYDIARRDYLVDHKSRLCELADDDLVRQTLDVQDRLDRGVEADRCLGETEHVLESRRLRDEECEREARICRREYFSLLCTPFSKKTQLALEKYINKYPYTLSDFFTKRLIRYDDDFEQAWYMLNLYKEAISFFNNFYYLVDEGSRDQKILMAHMNFGWAEAKKLLLKLREMRDSTITLECVRSEILMVWGDLEFPVENLIGSLHRRVKRQGGLT